MTTEANANSTVITFDLTKGDETRFHLYAQPQSIRILLGTVPWVLIAFPLVMVALMVHLVYFGIGKGLTPKQRQQTFRHFGAPILALLALPLEGVLIIGHQRRSRRNSKPVDNAHRSVALGPGGINYAADQGSVCLPWSALKKTHHVQRDVFLVYASQTRMRVPGIIIPDRAFPDNDKAAAFTAHCEEMRLHHIGVKDTASNSITFIVSGQERYWALAMRERLVFKGPILTPLGIFGKIIAAAALIFGVSPIFGAPGSIADILHPAAIATAILITVLHQLFVTRTGPRVASLSFSVSSLEPKEVSLVPAGVSCKTLKGSDLVAWASFSEIVADKHALYFLSRQVDTLVIPLYAFSSPEAASRFLEIARDYLAGRAPEPDQPIWPPAPSN